MTMKRFAATMLMAVLALAGCDVLPGQTSPPEPSEAASAPADDLRPGDPAPTVDADGETVTGTLSGDAQLEGGCVWLETVDGNIEPQLPDGYTAMADPVALVGPDGEVIAEQGDQVAIVGSPAVDIMTTCQVGAVWRVSAVKLAD